MNQLAILEDIKTENISIATLSICPSLLKDEFFKRMSGKAKQTLDEYRRSIARLYEFMNVNKIDNIEELTESRIKEFQLTLFNIGNSAVTTRYHIKALRRFCNYLATWRLIKFNPFKYCDIIPSPERLTRPKRYYTHEEALRWYNNYLKKHYGFRVARCYFSNLKVFILYLEGKDIKSISSVKHEDLKSYADYIWNYRTLNGRNYTPTTIRDKLEDIKKFYRVFFLEGCIDENPSKRLNIRAFLRSKLPDTRPRQIIIEKDTTIFNKLALEFKSFITTKGFVEKSIRKYTRELEIFFNWLKKQSIEDPKEVTKHVIMNYYKEVHNYRKKDDKSWSSATIHNHLIVIRKFFDFLAKFDYIAKNPTEYIDLPKYETGLPTRLLKNSEAKRILESIDPKENLALRDKAIIELLYSTGIRANELCHIELNDVDFESKEIIIRQPKGGRSRQRVVPFGAFADKALKEYIENLRPKLLNGYSKALFLSKKGHMMNNHSLCDMVKEHVRKAGIKNKITTHSFRVGCATEMLRGGADVRYVQTLLGHKRIETTQIYTRVNIDDLKKIHKKFHPREKYYRKVRKYL